MILLHLLLHLRTSSSLFFFNTVHERTFLGHLFQEPFLNQIFFVRLQVRTEPKLGPCVLFSTSRSTCRRCQFQRWPCGFTLPVSLLLSAPSNFTTLLIVESVVVPVNSSSPQNTKKARKQRAREKLCHALFVLWLVTITLFVDGDWHRVCSTNDVVCHSSSAYTTRRFHPLGLPADPRLLKVIANTLRRGLDTLYRCILS